MVGFLPRGRRLPEDVWRGRHRGLTWLLLGHVPALFLFGLLRGAPPVHVASEAAILLPAVAVAACPRLGRNVRSAGTSLGLVVAASILVHESDGAIEAHFHFFVILAFLTMYQAWLPFLLALGYVVGEHGLVGTLQPALVFSHPSAVAHPWRWAAIHGGFVLAASLANVLSWRLTEQETLRDGLTHLPNRLSLLDSLARAMEQAKGTSRATLAVLVIDLDNFRDANDAFGHDVGDAVLRTLAARLNRLLGADDVLARLGGDEFALMLRGWVDHTEVRDRATRVLQVLGQPVQIGDLSVNCSASVGIAYASADVSTPVDVLRNADLAMYESKRQGRGRVAEYTTALHTVALNRTEVEAQLRDGLAGGQFELAFQPILDLETLACVGAEALVRWRHPSRGLLAPAQFITVAEQSGLIVPLGSWVLRAACHEAAQWQRSNPRVTPLTVAVNLAPQQLEDRRLVTVVAEALRESELDASSLCLEITEGSVIKNFEATMPTLTALRSLGVALALDDFGTGYSSLSYLRQLPVTSIKIDRTFVADLGTANAEIVTAIIRLAHAMGLTVTAEGIETEGQLGTLRAMGCDLAQGYLLGRPGPSADLPGHQLTNLLGPLPPSPRQPATTER